MHGSPNLNNLHHAHPGVTNQAHTSYHPCPWCPWQQRFHGLCLLFSESMYVNESVRWNCL